MVLTVANPAFVPTLEDYDEEHCCIIECNCLEREVQRIFAAEDFRANNQWKNSFVRLSSGGQDGKRFWVAKVLLMYRLQIPGGQEGRECAFLQYMKWTHR